jgi:hypothetical protein
MLISADGKNRFPPPKTQMDIVGGIVVASVAKLRKNSAYRMRAVPRSPDHPQKRRLRRRRFEGSQQAPKNPGNSRQSANVSY